jgi:predicted RNA-binding protein with RPS1 domain
MNITKGKWETSNFEVYSDVVTIADICHNYSKDGVTREEAEANAQLIALAGNLQQKLNLEAYEEVVEASKKLIMHSNQKDLHPIDFQRLESALKKATEEK